MALVVIMLEFREWEMFGAYGKDLEELVRRNFVSVFVKKL
jgi:hypothetical protein